MASRKFSIIHVAIIHFYVTNNPRIQWFKSMISLIIVWIGNLGSIEWAILLHHVVWTEVSQWHSRGRQVVLKGPRQLFCLYAWCPRWKFAISGHISMYFHVVSDISRCPPACKSTSFMEFRLQEPMLQDTESGGCQFLKTCT